MRHLSTALLASALASSCSVVPPDGDWPSYHRDAAGTRYSPLTQITPANVASLRPAWTYHMRPANSSPASGAPGDSADDAPTREERFSVSQATPLVVDNVMYLPTPYGRVVALDASSGAERWVYELPNYDQAATRGVEYWPGIDGAAPAIIVGTRSGKLISLDAKTGKPNDGFGASGVVDMKTPEVMNDTRGQLGMSSPPLVYRNLIITGSRVQETPSRGAAGDVRAWDARTGKLVWTFHSVPRPGETGHDTWEGDSWKNRSGVNVWTFLVLDAARGIVYLPFGAPTFDRWGGDRHGANLFANSIVALEAATGKYLWHFQTVHHDIWDLDLPAATLVEIKRNGRTIPAIAVMNKSAVLFLLDRRDGTPIYPVKEAPVPTDTDIPGEAPWPTQPMPAAPPPLTRLSFAMDEIANVTPEHRAFCERLIKDKNIVASQAFQPLRGDSAVASFPGSLGGVDWGGAAFDPKLGYYIVNLNALASPQQLAKRPDGSWNLKEGYVYFWDPATRMPCQQPPWGELAAVNVNTGAIAWRSVLGVSENLSPAAQHTGRPSAGGPITTASGLTFIGGTDDRRIRAFNSSTGAELWTFKLPASIYGTPMTYQDRNGKQYVAAVSTGGFVGDAVESDAVTAFSLP